jgi:two-component system sensor histidine kinase GlrK
MRMALKMPAVAVQGLREREVVSLLAHELKGPASSVVTGIALLRSLMPWSLHSDVVEVLDVLDESSRALIIAIDELSLLGADLEACDPEPVLLNHVVPTAVQYFQRSSSNRIVNLQMQQPLPAGSGNPFYVETIVRNLLLNADKHSNAEESIEVSARWAQEELLVSVRDHGHGVERNELERIFELFYRSERAKGQTSGTGVGLYLCRKLVMKMGGRIWAQLPESRGLEVTFALPPFDESPTAA